MGTAMAQAFAPLQAPIVVSIKLLCPAWHLCSFVLLTGYHVITATTKMQPTGMFCNRCGPDIPRGNAAGLPLDHTLMTMY